MNLWSKVITTALTLMNSISKTTCDFVPGARIYHILSTRSRGLSSGCDQAWPCVASHNWQPGESITEEVFKRKFRNSFWFFSSVLFPYHLLSSIITIWQCTNFYTMSCNVAANLFECLCVPLLSHKLLVNIVGHTPPFYIYKVTFLNVSHTSQC